MSQVCPDLIVFLESPAEHPDRWVVMNAFTRDCLGASPEVFSALSNPDEDVDTIYSVWDIWRFSHTDGLLADPSRFRRNASTWGDAKEVSHTKLVELLKKKYILIDDYNEYLARFDIKKSLLDQRHFGTYHQQLGQQLIAFERVDPSAWWLKQKFTPDLLNIRRDNLYGAVQDCFLDEWLPKKITPGLRVLDLGCGAGFISQKMARYGASVLGIDPNPEYIRLATERVQGDVSFQVVDLNAVGSLDSFATASFDCIYMSDALLFYFVPYDPSSPLDLMRFMADIKRILKPGGMFISLEPHPVFYIQPWLGDPVRPFTVVTEYANTQWRINPPLDTLVRPFLDNGFAITDMCELKSDPSNRDVGVRDAHFAAEFPVWLLIEFRTPINP